MTRPVKHWKVEAIPHLNIERYPMARRVEAGMTAGIDIETALNEVIAGQLSFARIALMRQISRQAAGRTQVAHWFTILPLVLCLAFSGCVTDPASSYKLPPPPAEQIRASLQHIAVECVTDPLYQARVSGPKARGQSAAAGALDGALEAGSALNGTGGTGPFVVAVLVLEAGLMVVGAAAGGISGALAGVPAQELESAKQALVSACGDLTIERSLQEQLVTIGTKLTTKHFSKVELLSSPNEPDAHLEIRLLRAGLVGGPEKRYLLAAFLQLHIRLVRPGQEKPLYEHTRGQRSGARGLREWTANDAQAFRAEVPIITETIAEALLEEMFLSYRPGKAKSH